MMMVMRIGRMHNLPIMLMVQMLWLNTVDAKQLTLDDFAYHATLSDAKSSVRQVTLPINVYENMQRRDYGDIRVFSSDGQVVPHQLIYPDNQTKTRNAELSYYPFSKLQAENPANIRVIIEQQLGRQNLDIHQQLNQKLPRQQQEFQYIIENHPPRNAFESTDVQKQTLCKLELEWEQQKPSAILPFSLETSNNLQVWKSVGVAFNVSRLRYAESQLVHNLIDFSCTSKRYLRLTWLKPKQKVHLTKVIGLYHQSKEQKIQWKSIAKPDIGKAGNWLFESDLMVRLSHMEFVAPAQGLLYQGKLFSRNDSKSAWQLRKNITQYRLTIGDENVQSDAFTLQPTNDRYWKFEPENEALLNGNQLPNIRVGWKQEQLLFLAQGNPPFILAYGNANITQSKTVGLSKLIDTFKSTGLHPDIVSVVNTQHNESFPQVDIDIPWKLIGLWMLLLIGTVLLAYMALSLYRQMDNH